ncbi:hypothetical protein VZ169_19325, partial [Acinetobacter baumannii]
LQSLYRHPPGYPGLVLTSCHLCLLPLLQLSGQAEPGSTVTVTYPDGTTATVVAGTDGSTKHQCG